MALVTVYTSNITNGTNNDAGSSYRMKITPSVGGQKIKVTFETSTANGAANLIAANCSAGVWSGTNYDTTATPVELKFSGASGFTLSGNSTRIESDLTDLGAVFGGGARTLIVVIDWSGSSTGNQISQVGDTQATDNNIDLGFFSGVATFNNATPGAPTSSSSNHGEAIRFVKVDVGGGSTLPLMGVG